MIVQICGTNASGKTTIIRKLRDMAASTEVLYDLEAKKPKVVGYDLTFDGVPGKVRLLGPYEAAVTGGMDALGGTAEGMYERIKKAHDEADNVLFEGIRAHNHTRGLAMLRLGIPYHVFLLDTPLEVVLEGLRARRAARGVEMLEDTSHIQQNVRRAANYAFKMYECGAKRYKINRDECPAKILEVFQKK
jgi:thymidylate kinase